MPGHRQVEGAAGEAEEGSQGGRKRTGGHRAPEATPGSALCPNAQLLRGLWGPRPGSPDSSWVPWGQRVKPLSFHFFAHLWSNQF